MSFLRMFFIFYDDDTPLDRVAKAALIGAVIGIVILFALMTSLMF